MHERRNKAELRAFERDLLALLPRLRRFARALAIEPADADDLCQVALEKALKAEAQWERGTRLDSWMYRIMRNCWIDEVRARKRRSETFVEEEEGAGIGDADDRRIEARVELGKIDRAMASVWPPDVDNGQRAFELARSRAGRLAKLPRVAQRRRLLAFLARRGYTGDIAHKAVSQLV